MDTETGTQRPHVKSPSLALCATAPSTSWGWSGVALKQKSLCIEGPDPPAGGRGACGQQGVLGTPEGCGGDGPFGAWAGSGRAGALTGTLLRHPTAALRWPPLFSTLSRGEAKNKQTNKKNMYQQVHECRISYCFMTQILTFAGGPSICFCRRRALCGTVWA